MTPTPIWTRFPSQLAVLDPSVGKRLESALFWAACGQIGFAKKIFEELIEQSDAWIISLEYSEVLRKQGLRHEQLAVLQKTLSKATQDDISECSIRLALAESRLRTAGELEATLDAARNLKSILNSQIIAADLDEFTTRSIILYYDVINTCVEQCRRLHDEDRYVFSSPDMVGKEPASIAQGLGSKEPHERWHDIACFSLWLAAFYQESEHERKHEIFREISDILDRMSNSLDPYMKFQAGTCRLRFGALAYQHEDIETARAQWLACKPLLEAIAIELPKLTMEASSVSITETAEEFSDWQTLAPAVALDYNILLQRCGSLSYVPISADDLTQLAAKADRMGHRAKQRALLMEAVSSANARYLSQADKENLAKSQEREAAYLEFESAGQPDALFLGAAMIRVLSQQGSLHFSWATTLGRCHDFFQKYRHFDAPIIRFQLGSLYLSAAQRLGRHDLSKIAEDIIREASDHATLTSGSSFNVGVESNPHSYWEAIHPLGQSKIDWMMMFHNCVRIMLRWLEDERSQSEEALSGGNDEDVFSAVSSNPLDMSIQRLIASMPIGEDGKVDSAKVQGVLGGPGPPPPVQTTVTSDELWKSWLTPVEDWLLEDGKPPFAEFRHYVLKTLIQVRCNYCLWACMKSSGDLPSLQDVMNFVYAERKRVEVYSKIVPESLGPDDRRVAKQALITIPTFLSFQPTAFQQGLVTDADLRMAQEASDELAQEWGNVNKQTQEYTTRCTNARIRWQRYLKYRSVSCEEMFESLDKAEAVANAIRRQQATVASARDNRNLGATEFVSRAMVGKMGDLNVHLEMALVTALEQVYLSVINLESIKDKADEHVLQSSTQKWSDAWECLVIWIERSKARSIMDVSVQQIPLPQYLVAKIEGDGHASSLYYEELKLSQKYLDPGTRFDRKILVTENLEKVRLEMGQHPILSDVLRLREGSPASLALIKETLQKSSEAGHPFTYVEIINAVWTRHPGNIYLIVHQVDKVPQLIPNDTINSATVTTWWTKHIEPHECPLEKSADAPAALAEISGLISRLSALIPEKETIVFCPANVVHRVPLHALPVNPASDSRPLIERNPVVYCQSFSHLRYLLDLSNKAPKAPVKAAIIHALTHDYDGPEDSLRTPRRSAGVAENLARRFDTTVLRDDNLDKDNFLDLVEDANVIHWHGHVSLNGTEPLRSAMLLGRTAETSQDTDDETRVPVKEIFNISLSQPALAIVQGCQSARSEVTRSGDLIGLNTAMHYAGASSVVSSLWKIADDDAATYSKAFFEALDKQTLDKIGLLDLALAHQEAVLSLMQKDNKGQEETVDQHGRRAPYHWAAFTLNGSWLFPDMRGMVPDDNPVLDLKSLSIETEAAVPRSKLGGEEA